MLEHWVVRVLRAKPGGAFGEFTRIVIQDVQDGWNSLMRTVSIPQAKDLFSAFGSPPRGDRTDCGSQPSGCASLAANRDGRFGGRSASGLNLRARRPLRGVGLCVSFAARVVPHAVAPRRNRQLLDPGGPRQESLSELRRFAEPGRPWLKWLRFVTAKLQGKPYAAPSEWIRERARAARIHYL